MRNIINISMPEVLVKEVSKEVKLGGFASKSEFFRHILRERMLAKELDSDRKTFESGEGVELKSLKDLV